MKSAVMMKRIGGSLVGAIILLMVAGCGSDDAELGEQRSRICQTDNLEEWEARPMPEVCTVDMECPCGTHCDLGECVAACTDGGDCEDGLVCDSFGRCQTEENADRPERRSGERRGRVHLTDSNLTIYEQDRERRFRIGARHEDLRRVRLQAQEGIEIACGDENFSQRCEFSGGIEAVARDDRTVRARATDEASFDGERYVVRVFADRQRETVNINARTRGESEEEVSGQPGVYQGYAWPEGSGFVSRTRNNEFSDDIRRMRVPVEIVVYPSEDARSRVAQISDGLNLLFPEGEMVGEFERDQGSPWEFETARQIFTSADERPYISQPILVNGNSRSVEWQGPTLTINHRMLFEGVVPGARSPYVDWQISVSQTHAFEEGEDVEVPAVTQGHPVVDADDVIGDRLPLEDLVDDYFNWGVGSGGNDFGSRQELVEAVLCNEYPSTSGGLSPAVAHGFSGDIYEMLPGNFHPSGELACETGEPPKAFELLNDSVLDVYENMETCFDDFERAELSRQTGALDTTPSDCVDEARFIYALTTAQHADRERSLGDGNISDDRSSAIAHRLLQQWLSLHTFVGREYSKVETFNMIVPAAQAVDLNVNRLDVIDRITRGFDLLLTPRVAAPLVYLPTNLVRDPDYREQLFPGSEFPPQRTHDQSVGIPVAMLQTYGEQLSAIGDFLEDVQYARNDISEIEEPTQEAIAQGFLLMALAQGVYDEMRVGGEPTWEGEWQIVRRQVGSRVAGEMDQLEDARDGVNPLGIGDVDLPLYRIGDQTQTIQRFSAVSDFLVGASPGDPSVASVQVAQAEEALEGARVAWLDNVERDLDEQLGEDAQARRLETILRDYGGQVNGLCGGTGYGDLEVLENADDIDGNSCYLAPHCEFDVDSYTERLSASGVGNDLCVTSLYRDRLGPSVTSGSESLDEALDDLADIYGSTDGGIQTSYGDPLPLGRHEMKVRDSEGNELLSFDYDPEGFKNAISRIPEEVPDEIAMTIQEQCQSHRQYTQSQRPDTPGECSTVDDCPVGFYCDGGQCEPDEAGELDDPDCYQGALGEAALELRSLATAVDQSRSKLQEYSERYDTAMESCMIQLQGAEAKAEANLAHNLVMSSLNLAKFGADSLAYGAAAGRQSSGADTALTFGATAAFAVTEAAAKIASAGLQVAMDEAERYHKQTIAAIETETTLEKCINDAEMHLIGIRSQTIDIQRASQNMAQQVVAFENLQGSVDGLLSGGLLALETEVERTRSPIDLDFWIDERITSYDRYMRAARRAVYLSVMAVEYEYQFSSAEREAALAAQTPDELARVLSNLRSFTMAGNVGGSNPGELLSVVSLRDHVLQIRDSDELPSGFHQMSREEQFQAVLNSPHFAVYEDGDYKGQEIPFQLAPLGQQELGDYQGISLLAGTDCAERLWSANLSLVGDELYRGDDPSFSRVVLRKRNTFFSQWCDGSLQEDPYQLASTRPSRNLFIDPYARNESTTPATSAFGGGDETEAFSNSRVSAYFNIPRRELETEAYAQGATTELAGRGLYGDYALFFPAETISTDGGTGLDLEQLEDILVRVDYVSVSR